MADSRCGDDAARSVRHFLSWNLARGFDDGSMEERLPDDIVAIRKGSFQFVGRPFVSRTP
jgi:hypothetical protein